MRAGRRRPPRAQSSGLRLALGDDGLQRSFTESCTNTTNSSEASPRHAPSQQAAELDNPSGHGGDAWFRSASTQFDESSAQALPRLSGERDGAGLRHMGSFSVNGDADEADAGGDASSQFGGSSVTGLTGAPGSAYGGHRGRASFDPCGKMSLLQLQRAIEKIMVSDGEMYAKLQAGLKGIHSLAKETSQLKVARDVTGATCINQYVLVKTLGRGSYGKVKLCLNTLDGQLYAIKMMNRSCLLRTLQRSRAGLRKSARRSVSAGSGIGTASAAAPPPDEDEVNREIAILKKLDHPNVVKLYEVIDPPGAQYMMLVMEFLEKGPVLRRRDHGAGAGGAGGGGAAAAAGRAFERLPEELAADFFRQAVAGLEYLHHHKVVHGDIKPENLLVSSNGELKISDFGCSRMADGQSSQQRLSGTPAFTAPELVSGDAADPFAADVWALGACLYCFVYGRLPFQGESVLDVFRAISSEELQLPPDIVVSPALRHLFGRLFDKDPATRISLQEVMAHPWVTDDGRLPLHSCADLGLGAIEVTPQEQLGAIDRASVVSMIRARLKEKVFRSKEYLFQAGAPMDCVYFIMAGVVELTRPAGADDAERDVSGGTSMEHSFTVDLDESLMLDCAAASLAGGGGGGPGGGLGGPGGAALGGGGAGGWPHGGGGGGLHGGDAPGVVNGRLHIDRLKARDLKHRHRGAHILEGSEVVVDVKGPGHVVGEVFMSEAPPPCRYSARARGDVLALKLTQENYVRALAAMYYEAESGARASASDTTGSGRPAPATVACSPGLLGGPAAAGGGGGTGAGDGAAAAAGPATGGPGAGQPLSSVGAGSAGSAAASAAGALQQQAPGRPLPAGQQPAGGQRHSGESSRLAGSSSGAGGLLPGAPRSAGTGGGSYASTSCTCSLPEDAATAPLSGGQLASSSGSLARAGSAGGAAASARLARLEGAARAAAAGGSCGAGPAGGRPGPLQFIGSEEATDEER